GYTCTAIATQWVLGLFRALPRGFRDVFFRTIAMKDALMDIQDLATRLKIPPKTIRNKLSNGTWPIQPVRIGRALRWRESDVARAIANLPRCLRENVEFHARPDPVARNHNQPRAAKAQADQK